MAALTVEQRLAMLEAEVARLRKQVNGQQGPTEPPKESWLDKVYGAFAGDPLHEEAMRLGRKYRASLRPKAKRKPRRKRPNADS